MGMDQAVQESQIGKIRIPKGHISDQKLTLFKRRNACVVGVLEGVVRAKEPVPVNDDKLAAMLHKELVLMFLKIFDFSLKGHWNSGSHWFGRTPACRGSISRHCHAAPYRCQH